MAKIRGNSVLPARREAVTLHTADRLELVGELALPPEADPVATLVCLHPLPTHGGMMDSQIFRKASFRLPALADVAVLRFNTRGTTSLQGTSEGEFDNAVGEKYDVAAAIEYAEFHDLPYDLVGGLVVRDRPHADVRPRPGGPWGDPVEPAAPVQRPRAPRRVGRGRQAAEGAGPRARRLSPAEGGPRAVRRRTARRAGRGRGRQAPVGRRRRARAGRDRARCSTPRSRCRCRPSGTARWRSPTPAPTTASPPGRADAHCWHALPGATCR